MLAKTNPFLSLVFDPKFGHLLLEEPLSKVIYENDTPLLLELLYFCIEPRTVDQVKSHLLTQNIEDVEITEDFVIELMKDCIQNKLLIVEDEALLQLEEKKKDWIKHGWIETWFYHFWVYKYPFLNYEKGGWKEDDRRTIENLHETEPPSIYKKYDDSYQRFALPDPSVEKMKALKFMANSRTEWDDDTFSIFSYLCYGETGQISLDGNRKYLLKTSPSGGARHTSEAYIYFLNNKIVPRGIYHYSVKEHELVKLKDLPETYAAERKFLFLQRKPTFSPEFIVVITSCVNRSMWRYRESRSSRAIFLDIGHVVSTTKHVSHALGYDVVESHGFDKEIAQTDLDIEVSTEAPIYFTAIGNYH